MTLPVRVTYGAAGVNEAFRAAGAAGREAGRKSNSDSAIIKTHGGDIRVVSEFGGGTAFALPLPIHEERDADG